MAPRKTAKPSKPALSKKSIKGSGPTTNTHLAGEDLTTFEKKGPHGFQLPMDILCEVLDILNELDDKPPQALCRFMGVCRHFKDVACAAHSLWAAHVLAPLFTKQRCSRKNHESRVIALVSMLAERSIPAFLTLQLPPGVPGPKFPDLMTHLLPSLLLRAQSIEADLGPSSETSNLLALWDYLRSADVPHLHTLSVSASMLVPISNRYTQDFPYASSPSAGYIALPSLRSLRLVNSLPPCLFPGLRSLSIERGDMNCELSSQDFIEYLRSMPQLTHLLLYQCLLDARSDSESHPVQLSHLEVLELKCAPRPCALFLERVCFPSTAVVNWKDTMVTREPMYDLSRMIDCLREHSKPTPQHHYKAVLCIDSTEGTLTPSDDLSNVTGNSSFGWNSYLPNITLALYHETGEDSTVDTLLPLHDLAIQLECVYTMQLLQGDNLLRLVRPGSVTSLTVAARDPMSNDYLHIHLPNILRDVFPTLNNFAWYTLTTPERLALILKAVLDPVTTPLLRALRIRELGQQRSSPWTSNPSVLALCESLRARREAGCALKEIPSIATVTTLLGSPDRKEYRRGESIESGADMNELLGMLAEAQGSA